MSVLGSFKLRLRPYKEVDTCVPDIGLTCLPGRIAALSHPINAGSGLLIVDRDRYSPDIAVVASSGVRGFEKGDVIVLEPDHGAFYDGFSPDGRELRMIGVVKPWWESVIGKWSDKGFAPAPGWILIERDSKPESAIEIIGNDYTTTGYIVADCSDIASQEGDYVCFDRFNYYEFDSCLPKSFVVVKAMNASKNWLRSLSDFDKVHQ